MQVKLIAVAAAGVASAVLLLTPAVASATPSTDLGSAHGTSDVCAIVGEQIPTFGGAGPSEPTAHVSPHVFVHHFGHHHK